MVTVPWFPDGADTVPARRPSAVEDAHLTRRGAAASGQARYFAAEREAGRLVRPWNTIVIERILRIGAREGWLHE